MTISATHSRKDYVGNGVLATYPFDFTVFASSDLKVYVAGALQVLGVHYTVTGTLPGTGNVVFTAGNIPAAAAAIVIEGDTPLTQATDLAAGEKFYEESLEQMVDKATILLQQIKNRALLLPLGHTVAGPIPFPSLSSSKFLRTNPAGSGLEFVAGSLSDIVGVLDDVVPVSTGALFPAPGTAGRLRGKTDGPGGLWMDDGVQWNSIDKFGAINNVKDFGAVGDGLTDDYAAIAAALATAGPVYFPPGTYLVNTKIATTNPHVYGHKGLSTIKAGATFPITDYLFDYGGVPGSFPQNSVVDGLIFNNNARALGVRFKCLYHATIKDLRSSNATGAAAYGFTFCDGLVSNRFSNLVADSCTYGFLFNANASPDYILDNSFVGLRSQCEKGGIYFQQGCNRNTIVSTMIDCYSVDAATFGVKVAAGAQNNYNTFIGVVAENTSANGTAFDDSSTSRNVYLNAMASSGWATAYNISSYNWHLWPGSKFSGPEFVSNNRMIVLSGRLYGESPDGTMTWPAGDVRSAIVAGDGNYDIWDFPVPVRNGGKVTILSCTVLTDDAAAESVVQLFKQNRTGTTTQVGADSVQAGSVDHVTGDFNYTIEDGYHVFARVKVKRSAGTYLYVYPLQVEGAW